MQIAHKLLIAFSVAGLLLSACDASTQPATSTNTQPASPSEPSAPTETPAPADTSTPAPTATFSGPWLTPLNDDVDCRFGPTPLYEQVGTLFIGSAAEITGVSEDGGWFQTVNPKDWNKSCWFNGDLVATNGDLGQLAVIPAPIGEVTMIVIEIPKNFIGYPDYTLGYWPDGFTCDKSVNYVIFSTIWINGPATVTYHWEIHGDTDIIGDEMSSTFSSAGDYSELPSTMGDQDIDAFDFTVAQCGDFSVKFVVSGPNPLTLDGQFAIPIECPDNGLAAPMCAHFSTD